MNCTVMSAAARVMAAALLLLCLAGSLTAKSGDVNSPVQTGGAAGNFQAKVTPGMSKADVIAILGLPCGEVAKDNHLTLYFAAGDVIEFESGRVQSTSTIFVRQGIDPVPQPQTSSLPVAVTTNNTCVSIVPGYRNAEFAELKWEILRAKDMGCRLTSNNPLFPNSRTTGKYIYLVVRVTNKTKKEERLSVAPVLVDDQNREFGEIDTPAYYLVDNIKTNWTVAMPPSIPKVFHSIFEVAADSNDLKYRTREFTNDDNTCDVPLKLP